MKPTGNIMAQARQAFQGAQGSQPPIAPPPAPQMPQNPGLPIPPPPVAMKLAQVAQTLDPMVLGTLIWRALKQHGESMNSQGMQDLGGQPMPPMGA